MELMLFLLSLIAGVTSVFGQTDVGDSCTTASGSPGTCTEVRKCVNVHDSFRTKHPVICGFQGVSPIVCCPRKDSVSTDTGTSVASPSINFECGLSRPRIVTHPLDFFRRRRASHGPESGSDRRQRFIVNGKESLIDSWPWMALLGKRNRQNINWFCGGVLINEQWVLTATHCFFDHQAEVVRLGEHNYNDDRDGANHRDFSVIDTIVYPDFRRPVAYHDLALVKIGSRVTIQRSIRPVCLPWGSEQEKNMIGETTTITGWGDTLFGGFPSSTLQEAEVVVVSSSDCDKNYSVLPSYSKTWPQGIGEETLCANNPTEGSDACQGDSGGPLVSKAKDGHFVLAAIVSQGFGCGHKDFPGVYVNLRHSPYLAWIKKIAFSSR